MFGQKYFGNRIRDIGKVGNTGYFLRVSNTHGSLFISLNLAHPPLSRISLN